MSWNHRVVRKVQPDAIIILESFGIHEVYYDKKKRATSCTVDPIAPYGETIADLKECLEMMLKAVTQPVLDFDKIPEEGAEDIGR